MGHEVSQYNIVNLPTYLKSYKRRKGAVKIVCRMNGFFSGEVYYNIESYTYSRMQGFKDGRS